LMYREYSETPTRLFCELDKESMASRKVRPDMSPTAPAHSGTGIGIHPAA